MYGVVQSVDVIYVNFFTEKSSAEAWMHAGNRMGDEVIGPIPLEIPEDVTLPIQIILGVNAGEMLQAVYYKPEEEAFELSNPNKHAELLGPYTVYEDMEMFNNETQS